MNIGPLGAGPAPRQRPDRSEVRERVVVAVRLGMDIGSIVVETRLTAHRWRITLDLLSDLFLELGVPETRNGSRPDRLRALAAHAAASPRHMGQPTRLGRSSTQVSWSVPISSEISCSSLVEHSATRSWCAGSSARFVSSSGSRTRS
jgi:hypothetical protein